MRYKKTTPVYFDNRHRLRYPLWSEDFGQRFGAVYWVKFNPESCVFSSRSPVSVQFTEYAFGPVPPTRTRGWEQEGTTAS